MATLGISEFTFAFAFLHEQTVKKWGNLKVAPILPSLYDEGSLGWDANLPTRGADYYYQFKLSDYLSGNNASYIRDGTYSDAYYRISLYRRHRNRQHRNLKQHACDHPFTYYVAPEINSSEEFNHRFVNSKVTEGSRLIPLKDCDWIRDSDQHYITFQEGEQGFRQHSSASFREGSVSGEDIIRLYAESTPSFRSIDNMFFEELFLRAQRRVRAMAEVERHARDVREVIDYDPADRPRHEILERLYYVLSAYLGVTLVIVGEGQKNS